MLDGVTCNNNIQMLIKFLLSFLLVLQFECHDKHETTQPECYQNLTRVNVNWHIRNIIPLSKDKLIMPSYNSILYFYDISREKIYKQLTIFDQYLYYGDQINSLEGSNFFAILSDYTIRKYNQHYEEVKTLTLDNSPRAFVYDAEQQLIIVYGNTNKIHFIDLNLNIQKTLSNHHGMILATLIFDDLLISGGTEKALHYYDFKTGVDEQVELSDITNNKFSSVIYDYVAFGNGNMVIFDVEAKKVLFEDKKHAKDTDVSILATIEHHKQQVDVIVSADTAGFVHFLNRKTLETMDKFKVQETSIKDMYYLQGNKFLSVDKNGSIQNWTYGCYTQINQEL